VGAFLRLLVLLVLLAASACESQITAAPPSLSKGAVCRLGSDQFRGKSDGGLIFLPDSKTFVTNAGLCDVQTGEWIKRFPEGHADFLRIALSPRQDRFATLRSEFNRAKAASETWIDYWDLTGELQSSLRLEIGGGLVTFLPGGNELVTAGRESVLVQDASTGNVIKSQPFPKTEFVSMNASPAGDVIACGGRYDLWFWKWQTDEPPQKVTGVKRGPAGGAFSPDGRFFAAEHGFMFGVSLIDVQSREIVRPLWHDRSSADSMNLVFSSDGVRLFAPQLQGGVDVYNVATGERERNLASGGVQVKSVALSADGRWLVGGGNFNTSVAVWDTTSWKAINQSVGHRASIRSTAYSRDGSIIATSSSDRTIRLWEAATGRERAVLADHTAAVNKVAFSPDTSRLASMSVDDSVRIWSVPDGKLIKTLPGHGRFGGAHSVLLFSDDGRLLTSVGNDLVLRRWNLESFELSSQVVLAADPTDGGKGFSTDSLQPMALDSVGGTILLRSRSRALIVNSTTGAQAVVPNWPSQSRSVAVAGDGRTVAVIPEGEPMLTLLPSGGERSEATKKHTLELLDAVTGNRKLSVPLPDAVFPECAFSPDGSLIAVVLPGSRGPVVVYDAATGNLRYRIDGENAYSAATCFSPDSSHLVTSTQFGVLTLWDLSQFAVNTTE
jgi:WD40 repeat protein